VALLDAAPTTRMNGYLQQKADPLTTFDVKRFNAIRGQQAQLGREIRSCLKELRQLKKDARAACTDEPDTALRNEPGHPPTANDDVPIPRYPGGFDLDDTPRNEPGNPPLPPDAGAANPGIAAASAGASGLRNEPGEAEAEEAGIEATRAALLVWAEARERRLRLEAAGAGHAAPLEPSAAIDQDR
jgi:hypothetical protein